MNLEQQVCSLELAKKLKELGVKQESLFYWTKMKEFWPLIMLCKEDGLMVRVDGFDETGDIEEQYSAFTVAELIQLCYEQFGYCDIPSKIGADKVADWLAEHLIINLQQNGDKH